MHSTAWYSGVTFFNLLISFSRFLPPNHDDYVINILDVGSCDVNGELKSAIFASELSNHKVNYVGIDIETCPNVDVVVPMNAKEYPFPDDYFDGVVTSSVLEHDPHFWMTFLKILRVLKPGGFLYINVPYSYPEHRYPIDCWRFYGDAGEALASWGRSMDYHVNLVYNGRNPVDPASGSVDEVDAVMIFYKSHDASPADDLVVAEDHFGRFGEKYAETTSDIFARCGWAVLRNRLIFLDFGLTRPEMFTKCQPTNNLFARNGSIYSVDEWCILRPM